MPVKHFLFNPYKGESDKETIDEIRASGETTLKDWDEKISSTRKSKISQEDNLNHVHDRVVVKVDMDSKNSYQFSNGVQIRLERKFNEFNRRITEPINCIIISGEGLLKGGEMLVDHNAFHESNRINDYKNSFENDESDKVRYFSVPIYECYAWRKPSGEWMPMPTFEFGLRVFKPYGGLIQGMPPTQLKDTLYVTTGELKGNVVKTVVAADYCIIFQGDNGREDYLIRFRPDGDDSQKMEPEAIAILHDETDKVISGEYLVGYSETDCKPISEFVQNDSIS